MPRSDAPPTTGIHHFSPTVSDVERSAEWYCRVFGLDRLPRTAPHHGDEEGGYAVLLVDPRTGLLVGLHHHEEAVRGMFDERRVGLDHIAWGVDGRAALEVWAAWLDEQDVAHSGVIDKVGVSSYSAIVFRDPDNIQLELFARF
jgi:glyoxylase I family protein